MKEIGIGIVGFGAMGMMHAHVLREMPFFYPGASFRPRLVSLCTRRAEAAQAALQTFGFAHATTDFNELLARPDVDVVSICTPNRDHVAMAVAALHAGKDVYIDKPLCMDADEARTIVRAVEESGRRLQIAHNNRFFPAVLRAKALIDEGRIGEVLSFRFDYLHAGSIDASKPVGWKQTSEGGVLLDLGAHILDLMRYLVGDPARVFCDTRLLYETRPAADGQPVGGLGEDQAAMLARLPNGALGTLEASKIATGTDDDLSFEIFGKCGALRFSLMQPNYLEFFDNTKPEAALGGERGFTRIACVGRYPESTGRFLMVKNCIGFDRAHMHGYYTFLRCLAEGGAPAPDVYDGLRLQILMDALRASARDGRWVNLD